MAPKRVTRANKQSSNQETKQPSEASLPQLASNNDEQRRIFILPKDLSPEARVLTLPNPATSLNSRYFYCPNKGLFEFMKIGVPRNDLRSWLITQPSENCHVENGLDDNAATAVVPENSRSQDYVLESPDLFIATPIDPVFFLMSLFQSSAKMSKVSFRLDDDYADLLSESSAEVRSAFHLPGFRTLLLNRLKAVSDVQQFGDDILLKPNEQHLTSLILEKSRNMIKDDVWPSSMEEAFIRKQLEIPIAPVSTTNLQLLTPEQSMVSSDLESQEAELPTEQTTTVASSSPSAPDLPSSGPSLQVKELMRLRVALNYITSSYLPKNISQRILNNIASDGQLDFTPLEEHLQKVKEAHAQVRALRSLSDNISRKRGALDDDEAAEARAEKKRKKEEEENRKKTESRAVKELKKVDTSGMKKLSSFFTKPANAAQSK